MQGMAIGKIWVNVMWLSRHLAPYRILFLAPRSEMEQYFVSKQFTHGKILAHLAS